MGNRIGTSANTDHDHLYRIVSGDAVIVIYGDTCSGIAITKIPFNQCFAKVHIGSIAENNIRTATIFLLGYGETGINLVNFNGINAGYEIVTSCCILQCERRYIDSRVYIIVKNYQLSCGECITIAKIPG